MRIFARWIYDGVSPPRENAVLEISEQGLVVGIDDRANDCDRRIDDGAIVPGLINAHTHLEFSHLQQPIEPRKQFAQWIQNVIAERRSRTSFSLESIRQGLEESKNAGVVSVAEIATSDWLFEEGAPSLGAGVVYREYLGLNPDFVAPTLQAAERFLEQAKLYGRQVGLSPHASYSLHPDLFGGLVSLAEKHDAPVMMHLAESPAEIELLRDGTGSLVELFRSMGIWRENIIPRRSRPLDFLRELSRLKQVMIAHGNELDDDEIRFLADHPQFSVVICPRTFLAMQPGSLKQHPWMKMREQGVRVVIGTDSRASNPDLSIWEELRTLHQAVPELAASDLLRMSTSDAAIALGLTSLGSLTPGKCGKFNVCRLQSGQILDVEESLFKCALEAQKYP